MPVPKYYCDYCDKQFQDTPADRKRHERGIQHQQAKARWYDSFKVEQQQQEQQQHLSNAQSSQGLPKPVCYHFVNNGFCSFGESCRYFHPNANNAMKPSMINAPNNMPQPSLISASNFIPQPSMISAPNYVTQSSMISTPTNTGSMVQNNMGMSWENLPPSLQPPPEGGYPSLPFVDWG